MAKDVDTEKRYTFRYDEENFLENLVSFSKSVDLWIGCNFLTFDTPRLNALFGSRFSINYNNVVDLQIVSRLVWFGRPGGHSVENFSKKYNLVKPPIDRYDDPSRVDDYVHRCEEDIEITYQMWRDFKRFIYDPSWAASLRVEHESALICDEMRRNGFYFNKKEAQFLLKTISLELETLTREIVSDIGDVVGETKTYTLRRNKDGRPDVRTQRLLGGVDTGFSHGDTISHDVMRPFNPGSPKDRILYLNSVGWNPFEKTKTHIEAERELSKAQRSHNTKEIEKQQERLRKLRVTGWRTSENNLETLPKDAPQGARKLAQWLTLEARRADLEEWLAALTEENSRIHGKFWHIGAWTHRMSHSEPNQANIFSPFNLGNRTVEQLSPVELIKYNYDQKLRALWEASPGTFLVGTDAEGIQLRILAHYMGDEAYTEAVVNGKKEDETDVHNVNKRALALNHIDRDIAKTFIYAFLLGAGIPKVASILDCSTKLASGAVSTFLDNLPALKHVKTEIIPRDANRGYFVGLDGRKVICNSDHLMLAGYLQNGEAVIMKHANVIWRNELNKLQIPYRQIDLVHDEYQTEAFNMKEAEKIGEVQRWAIQKAGKELGCLCPLAGSTKIGRNWAEAH